MGNQKKVETDDIVAWILKQPTPVSKYNIAGHFKINTQLAHYLLLEIAGWSDIWFCRSLPKPDAIASADVLERMEGEPAWMEKESIPNDEIDPRLAALLCEKYRGTGLT